MRKIPVMKWQTKTSDGKEIEESTNEIVNILLTNFKPEQMPKGIDKFRMYSRISKAIEASKESGVLELDESDYMAIKKLLEENAPAAWGMNKNVSEAIEAFLEAK